MADYLPVWALLVIVAPFVGSFLGVLIMRLPEGRPVLFSRSACERCGHGLAPTDLAPIASWLWLRGKCRYCGERIERFYPLVELGALAIVLWVATVVGDNVLVASCVLGWTLLALALTDWRRYVLPDALTGFLLLSGFAATYFLNPSELVGHVVGAGAGFLLFVAVAWIYRRYRQREGLGLGDAKLVAGLGAWVSWDGLASAVFFASALGLLFVLGKAVAGTRMEATGRVPFGTFLAAGGWLVWLYGPLSFG